MVHGALPKPRTSPWIAPVPPRAQQKRGFLVGRVQNEGIEEKICNIIEKYIGTTARIRFVLDFALKLYEACATCTLYRYTGAP